MKEKAKIIMDENLKMIEKKEEIAYNLYINCSDPTLSITNLAHSLNMSTENFIKYVCSYINKNITKPRYVMILNDLNEFDESNKDGIIKYLDNIEFPISFIEKNLISYIIYYRPDIFLSPENKLLINLRKKINMYKTHLLNKNISKSDNLTRIELARNTITKFLTSNFSLERFLLHERISGQTFKEHVATIKTLNNKEKKIQIENHENTTPTLYDIYVNVLNTKREEFNNNIKKVVFNLLNIINELDKDFSSIDFFLNTTYGPNEIIKAANDILSNEEMQIFRRHVSVYRRVYIYSERGIENLFKEKMVRNIDSERVEIDNQIKLQAINYLNENNIPIFNDSFENACVLEYKKFKKHR